MLINRESTGSHLLHKAIFMNKAPQVTFFEI